MTESDNKEILSSTRFLETVRREGWVYCHRPNARAVVCVLATTSKGLLLVEQFRIPLGRRLLELPAGLVGDNDPDEPLELAANRELLEETGYVAPGFERLWEGPSSAGLTDETITCFRATGELRREGPGGGVEGEAIRVHEIPLETLRQWLAAREAEGIGVDPKIYAALWSARLSC